MSDVGQKNIWITALNIPVYFVWGWLLFRSWEAFRDTVGFLFKPDFWSWIDGDYLDDIIAEGKLALMFIAPTLLIRLQLRLFMDI